MTGLQGRTFGGYQLLAPLGAGGVAEAYRAKPLQGSGREVVVKIIQPNLAQQPAFQTRFQLAMQKAAALANHTHVLPVLGSGEEGGFTYMVTPYVPEGTLRDWIGRGWRLGLTDVGPFFRQLATGLAYAHSLGIAHENLKPVNIYLFEGRHVLLGDFGVLWDVAQINPQLSGPAAEAVAYLAPEAFNKVFAPAADIYSLGAVLFTTLTGRAPFHGQTPGDVYSAHMNQPVPPLGATAPSLNRQLQSLDSVVQRAMAKRPDERYPTPLLFADAVESTLAQAQKGRLGKSRRPSVWSLGNDNPLTFNEMGMPVLAGQAGPASQIGGASAGGLQPLNFRRPTKVGGLDGLMEDGYIGGNWNDGGAPGALQVPAPLGQPVSPMVAPPMAPLPMAPPPMAPMSAPAPRPDYPPNYPPNYPPGYGPGYAPGYGQGYQPPVAAAPLTVPPPAPEQQSPMYRPSAQPAPGNNGVPDIPGMPNMAPGSAPLADEASKGDKNFSATELGLPRLTYADLGQGLSAGIAQEMESQSRGETGGRSGALDYDESQTYTATRGGAHIQYRGETNESAAWSAAYPTGEWGYPRSKAPTTRHPPSHEAGTVTQRVAGTIWRVLRRQRAVDVRAVATTMNIRMSARASSAAPHAVPLRPDAIWDAGYVRSCLASCHCLSLASRCSSSPNPVVCPGGVCDGFSSAARKAVPALSQLGGGASAASVSMTASPAALQITTPASAEKAVTFSLISAGASNVPWQATASPNWLTVSPAAGTLAAGSATPITVTAKPTGINPGQYTGAVTVSAGGGTLRVPVTITVAIGPQLAVSPPTLSFIFCASQQAITVKNTGDASVERHGGPLLQFDGGADPERDESHARPQRHRVRSK